MRMPLRTDCRKTAIQGSARGLAMMASLERLVADLDVLRLADEERADHEGHDGDDDRIPEAGVDVALLGDDRRCQQGKHAPEPAVPDVVRQGHRGVPDL